MASGHFRPRTVSNKFPDAASYAASWFAERLATYNVLPSGLTASALTPGAVCQMAVTVLDAVPMTETVPETRSPTNTPAPSGATASVVGAGPTGMVASTVLVAVLMADTVLRCV